MKRHILVTKTWAGLSAKSYIDESAAVTAFCEANGYDRDYEFFLRLFLSRGFLFSNDRADTPAELVTMEIY